MYHGSDFTLNNTAAEFTIEDNLKLISTIVENYNNIKILSYDRCTIITSVAGLNAEMDLHTQLSQIGY